MSAQCKQRLLSNLVSDGGGKTTDCSNSVHGHGDDEAYQLDNRYPPCEACPADSIHAYRVVQKKIVQSCNRLQYNHAIFTRMLRKNQRVGLPVNAKFVLVG